MQDNKSKNHATKEHGRIYTPSYLVKIILDFAGYEGENIIGKHIIDNSCGDGAFLCEIVKRYCSLNQSENLKHELESFIHGIELDQTEWETCIKNLNATAAEYGIKDIKWDVICSDTLTVDTYNKKMDFVVGNPPYVRVHNLNENIMP